VEFLGCCGLAPTKLTAASLPDFDNNHRSVHIF
jgi:hypothetical protein